MRRETVLAHLFVKMEDYLRIAGGAEPAASGAQFVAQLHIVEDFAIEGDRQLAARVGHRLLAVPEPHNRQPNMTEARTRRGEDPTLVRAAVADRGRHPFEKGLTVPY